MLIKNSSRPSRIKTEGCSRSSPATLDCNLILQPPIRRPRYTSTRASAGAACGRFSRRGGKRICRHGHLLKWKGNWQEVERDASILKGDCHLREIARKAVDLPTPPRRLTRMCENECPRVVCNRFKEVGYDRFCGPCSAFHHPRRQSEPAAGLSDENPGHCIGRLLCRNQIPGRSALTLPENGEKNSMIFF